MKNQSKANQKIEQKRAAVKRGPSLIAPLKEPMVVLTLLSTSINLLTAPVIYIKMRDIEIMFIKILFARQGWGWPHPA